MKKTISSNTFVTMKFINFESISSGGVSIHSKEVILAEVDGAV